MARRQFTGRVCWWELSCSVMVARFGEKEVFGSRVLVGATTRLLGERTFS